MERDADDGGQLYHLDLSGIVDVVKSEVSTRRPEGGTGHSERFVRMRNGTVILEALTEGSNIQLVWSQ